MTKKLSVPLDVVALTIDVADERGQPLGDFDREVMAIFTPTLAPWAVSVDDHVILVPPVSVRLFGSRFEVVSLLPTDTDGMVPDCWQWRLTFSGLDDAPEPVEFDLLGSAGREQRLSAVMVRAPSGTER